MKIRNSFTNLIRHGIATDSSIDAPTIVTDEDIQTGASVKKRKREKANVFC